MKVPRIGWPVSLLLLVFASSCVTTSREYVEKKLGYSSIKCRLVHFENLTSDEMERLADGIALHVDKEGCRATVQYEDQSLNLDVVPGSIIVFGGEGDFLLQPILESRVETYAIPEPVGSDGS